MNIWYRVRFPILATGMVSLVAGLWAGLLLLGLDLPELSPILYYGHGPLMAAGFLGVVIGLERAVAYGEPWTYSAPALTGVGVIVFIVGGGGAGPALVTGGAFMLVIVNIAIIRSQYSLSTLTMGAGSISLLIADILWFADVSIYKMVWWWAGFLILTIAAERLELSRYLRPSKGAQTTFFAASMALVAGMIHVTAIDEASAWLAGLGALCLAIWFGKYDISWRTVRLAGLPRFVAVCLLLGYVWLAVAGALALTGFEWAPGEMYDATLHSIFLGFVFSMIFGHAPIIAPAVLKIKIPYTPWFYSHLALLQLSLIVRVSSDLADWPDAHVWGGVFNEAALILFIVNSAASAIFGKTSKPTP